LVSSDVVHRRLEGGFKQWVLHGYAPAQRAGPYDPTRCPHPHQHLWWRVMYLTKVAYFSSASGVSGRTSL